MMSSVLLLSLLLRMVFNVFKDVDLEGNKINNIAMDKYLNIDVIFATYSFVVFYFIRLSSPHKLMNVATKN